MLAEGSSRAFMHTEVSAAPEKAIWALWTDVAAWSAWDGGLKRASLAGPFEVGASGQILPLSGPPAPFRITALTPNQSYSFETSLPLARLTVTRRFLPRSADGRTVFRHEVAFRGLLGWFWAAQFGPGFRRELPATMARLSQLALRAA